MAERDDPLYDVIFAAYFAPLGSTHPVARCQRIAAAVREWMVGRDGSSSTPPDTVNPRDCSCEHIHASSPTCRSSAPSRGAVTEQERIYPAPTDTDNTRHLLWRAASRVWPDPAPGTRG